MKCLYWNLRGLDNSPTKLAHKKLLILHKLDLCFIVEPWMIFSNFSTLWLDRLGMKDFCVHNRGSLLPNLWCYCAKAINPVLIHTNDQHISLHLVLNGKNFGLIGVYASN